MDFRVGRGWSEEELARGYARAASLPRNFSAAPDEMTPERGWNQVTSQSFLAVEDPGPVTPGGAFERIQTGLTNYTFSDPRIVEPHYPKGPLLNRRILLELKSLSLHILAPVHVAEVRSQNEGARQVFGFCLDTLQGHVEAGREWFLLSKDFASGEVRFRIRASWREGTIPYGWMRMGFHVLGRHYQRAWHHLAHARLRARLEEDKVGGLPKAAPIQFWASRALAAGAGHLEKEKELNVS